MAGIIDMERRYPDNGCVVGTGPYVATEVVTDDHVNLIKNVNYWDGEVKVDEITVRTISDGDTLAWRSSPAKSTQLRHGLCQLSAL